MRKCIFYIREFFDKIIYFIYTVVNFITKTISCLSFIVCPVIIIKYLYLPYSDLSILAFLKAYISQNSGKFIILMILSELLALGVSIIMSIISRFFSSILSPLYSGKNASDYMKVKPAKILSPRAIKKQMDNFRRSKNYKNYSNV